MKYSAVVAALCCVAVVTFSTNAVAANTYKTNPLGMGYRSSQNASQYGHPGGMLLTGRCNSYDSGFAAARANGAEILYYIDPVETFNYSICPLDDQFYGGSAPNAPKWPYPSYGARSFYTNMKLTDIRAGSEWSNRVVAFVERLMRENKFDGVFLDVVGSRLWGSLVNWESWPQWERDLWTQGNVDLVRRIDALRRQINPRFIVVNNNVWAGGGSDALGTAGEKYVDGVALEHHSSTSAWHRSYVGRAFGNLGHRRVLVIGKSTTDANVWKTVQGVTHVSDAPTSSYTQILPPMTGFNRLTDRAKAFGNFTGGTNLSSGMSANYQRGSKFWLADKATLLNTTAYVDGHGGSIGTQKLRMAIYADSGGRPGALLAQSSELAVSSGTSGRWVTFPISAVKLWPGNYWVMLHSGSTNALARVASSGNANWYGIGDTYTDGAANPAGSGSWGSTTLSLHVRYTMGH
jgi:hypothetical protein